MPLSPSTHCRLPLLASLVLIVCLAATSAARAAEAPAGVVIADQSGATVQVLTPEALAALPQVSVTVATEPGHGPPQRNFTGPLLWTILEAAHLADAAKFRDQVRQTILATGADGYTALVALGEISPEFEGKQVILAARMDGEPLGDGHLRLIVAGDKRAGRGVHDVVRLQLEAQPNGKH